MPRLIPVFIIALFLSISAKAQPLKMQPYFTAVTVSNIDTSISWYSKTLNLKLRNRVDNSERGFKQAILISEGIMIELVELVKGISPDSLLQQQAKGKVIWGYKKFGFTVPDIDRVYQQLTAMNVKFHGRMVTDPIDHKKTFLISDPDGNLIQFFEA